MLRKKRSSATISLYNHMYKIVLREGEGLRFVLINFAPNCGYQDQGIRNARKFLGTISLLWGRSQYELKTFSKFNICFISVSCFMFHICFMFLYTVYSICVSYTLAIQYWWDYCWFTTSWRSWSWAHGCRYSSDHSVTTSSWFMDVWGSFRWRGNM